MISPDLASPCAKDRCHDQNLITSALPYVNGIKHLGNLAGSLFPADVHARFRRQIGDDVLFICATDEHGTPAELGAVEAGAGRRRLLRRTARDPGRYLSALRPVIRPFRAFVVAAKPCVDAAFLSKAGRAGLIEERDLKPDLFAGRPAVSARPLCARHLPTLRIHQARGDQCDGCGPLLDPTDLIRPQVSALR